MINSNNQIKLKLILLLPLLISMGFVGFYSISNANQKDNLELNQVGTGIGLFPNMGYASIDIDGTTITGYTSISSISGIDISDGFIEFFTYRHEIKTGDSGDVTRVSARITAGPITITKRIDQATPLLAQGLIQNSLVEGFILFFWRDPDTGLTIEAFKVTFTQGRIISLRTFTVVGEGVSQIVEEVSFSYNILSWQDLQTSTEFEYSWSESA